MLPTFASASSSLADGCPFPPSFWRLVMILDQILPWALGTSQLLSAPERQGGREK